MSTDYPIPAPPPPPLLDREKQIYLSRLLTSSLDAVDALRERVLPGSRADIELGPQLGTVWENHIHHQGAIYFGGHTTSTVLAYLLAVLNALIAKETP